MAIIPTSHDVHAANTANTILLLVNYNILVSCVYGFYTVHWVRTLLLLLSSSLLSMAMVVMCGGLVAFLLPNSSLMFRNLTSMTVGGWHTVALFASPGTGTAVNPGRHSHLPIFQPLPLRVPLPRSGTTHSPGSHGPCRYSCLHVRSVHATVPRRWPHGSCCLLTGLAEAPPPPSGSSFLAEAGGSGLHVSAARSAAAYGVGE